jgi:tRNA A-37 threonylcarbamoyl transferase component Bud32/ABC-type phosphate/phosphonate transport system substrate-binding protein
MAVTPPPCPFLDSGRRHLGDFELLEEIGRGGMGVVYRARQQRLDRLVAVKLLLCGPHTRTELARRFRAEALAAGALHHPNIVAIHEVGEHEGRPFYAMELVEGHNLMERARNNPLPPALAADYVQTIARAVQYAHECGIIHRDLKPSNVLIDARDKPRLTDFGLAKRLGQDSEITQSGQVLGSPGFMAPEQAAGNRAAVGPWSDVYGLGAILFYLLTGRPPFQGKSMAETLQQVANSDPVSPQQLNPEVPRDLATICLKCLAKEPARRYRTAEELAEDLAAFRRDEPIRARPASWQERAWRWCRRNPAAAGLMATLLVALGTLIGLIAVLQERHRHDREATASIRALVIKNLEEMWGRPDTMYEVISSEQLAALVERYKGAAPDGARRFRMGLGATEDAVERAMIYQPMLDFMEQRLERLLSVPVRLDLVLSKEVRLNKAFTEPGVHLARLSALAFFRAREAHPRLTPLVREGETKDAVIWALVRSGITNLNQVRSIAFADTNSTMSACAKAALVQAGIRATNLSHYADLLSPLSDTYAHRRAVLGVLSNQFDAAVARPSHLANEVGVEGRDWVPLLKFESCPTLWAAGESVTAADCDALRTVLLELAKQKRLALDDRMRNLIPLDEAQLRELESTLKRDLELFDPSAAPDNKSPAP